MPKDTIQYRTAPAPQAGTNEAAPSINGYACLYETPTLVVDSRGVPFYEVVTRGAFDAILPTADVRCLIDHDPSRILGRNTSTTLKLESDEKGLRYDCSLDLENTDHNNAYRSIKRGDISQSSYAFIALAKDCTWTKEEGSEYRTCRINKMAALFDVSPVTYPATKETSVAARNAAVHSPLAGENAHRAQYRTDVGEANLKLTPEEAAALNTVIDSLKATKAAIVAAIATIADECIQNNLIWNLQSLGWMISDHEWTIARALPAGLAPADNAADAPAEEVIIDENTDDTADEQRSQLINRAKILKLKQQIQNSK